MPFVVLYQYQADRCPFYFYNTKGMITFRSLGYSSPNFARYLKKKEQRSKCNVLECNDVDAIRDTRKEWRAELWTGLGGGVGVKFFTHHLCVANALGTRFAMLMVRTINPPGPHVRMAKPVLSVQGGTNYTCSIHIPEHRTAGENSGGGLLTKRSTPLRIEPR